MILIVMAHRGEAQTFIKHFDFKASQQLKNTYITESLALCITGEGIYETINALSKVCQELKPNKIINIGIAGGLDKRLELEKIYSIRTAYGYNEISPKFKSFTTEDHHSQIDCISLDSRVLDDKQVPTLSHFAKIVDRELWGVGFVARSFSIPYLSYKLISDYAGAQTNCFDLKEKALYFSQMMLEFYINLELDDTKSEACEFSYSFHASFTQKARIENLLKKLSFNQKDFEQLTSITLAQKSKLKDAPRVILALESKINPATSQINKALKDLSRPLESIGAKIFFDKKLEKQNFTIQMEINSIANIEKLKLALEIFDYQKYSKIFEGRF